MLECGKNFRGSMTETCKECQVLDDENHRLNECPNWRETNLLDRDREVEFCDIFSNDPTKLMHIISHIQSVWELSFGNGSMKRNNRNQIV